MRGCAHAIEVEELALGGLPLERAAGAEAHAATCAQCGAALAVLREERAMFVRRSQALAVSPLAAAEFFGRLDAQQRASNTLRDRSRSWFVTALGGVALAAAVLLAVYARSGGAWSAMALRSEEFEPAASEVEPTIEQPASCERSLCYQTSLFASVCEPVTCWQPSASFGRRESVSCSQPTPLDWDGARCEADPTRNP
jgi:hypothetical protein